MKDLTKIRLITALILMFLGFGCGGDREYKARSAAENEAIGELSDSGAPQEVIVTSDDVSLPNGCRPREVAEVVIGFIDAFNRGDRESLNNTFFVSEGMSPPDFSQSHYQPWSWYSVSEVGVGGKTESVFVTYDQGELLRYFEKRHALGERLRLLKVSLTRTGLLGEADNVGFVYVLTRKAEDLDAGPDGRSHIASGQGAMNCTNRRIFTWTMRMSEDDGRTRREAADWICTDPPGWKPGVDVVACT